MTKISYRLKDENGQYFDADGQAWCDRTYTSFETIEEAKQVRLELNKGKQVARTGWTNPRLWLAKGKWGQIFILDDTPNELGFHSDTPNELGFYYNIPDCTATDWVLFKP